MTVICVVNFCFATVLFIKSYLLLGEIALKTKYFFIILFNNIDSLRFVGFCTDYQITWKDHITYISNKLSKSMAIIYRASHVLSL